MLSAVPTQTQPTARRRRSRAPPPVQASPLTPAAATRDSAAKQRADEKQQAVAKSQGITVDGKEEADTDPYAADGWGTHLAQFADYSLDGKSVLCGVLVWVGRCVMRFAGGLLWRTLLTLAMSRCGYDCLACAPTPLALTPSFNTPSYS